MKGIFATVVLIASLCVVAYAGTESGVQSCGDKIIQLERANNITEVSREALCKECGNTIYDYLMVCKRSNDATELKMGKFNATLA